MLRQILSVATDGADERRAAPSAVKPRHVVLVGNFPPRRCGIATFTRDVYEGLVGAERRMRCDVVAMNDGDLAYDYPATVTYQIRQNDLEDYARVAKAIAASRPDLLCVQHEFGIFGGPAGEHLLTLLYGVSCPVVITLHTVLKHPTPAQRRVMAALIARASRLIVMAKKGKEILLETYAALESKVVVVPHGAPDHAFVDSAAFKPALDLSGREVLLTFGLLSPNKGIESVIRALPAIVADRPDAIYVVLGATHPNLVARHGEAYRESLMTLARECGVEDKVRFVNAYVDNATLLEYLAAADIYITPYCSEGQITSGTLSYAVALGKPVIATPYWHAVELLANDVGVLVGFNDSAAIADGVTNLLTNDAWRNRMRRASYELGRETTWPRVAEHYLTQFSQVCTPSPALNQRRAVLPMPSLIGLGRMSDDCGVLQHSAFGVADRNHGYCLDDNARGLILACRWDAVGLARGAERLTQSCAAFVHHAWNAVDARFRNFMSYDRRWLEPEGSEDSFGRAFQAVAEATNHTSSADLRRWAANLARDVLPHVADRKSPRTRAFVSLGLCALFDAADEFPGAAAQLTALADSSAASLRTLRQPGWIWFEEYLAYDNARLAEALIRAGSCLRRRDLIEDGVAALQWLCALQSTPSGLFRAIGSVGLGARVQVAPPFDQQPLEAAATIDACAAAFDATGDSAWFGEAQRAYDWFFGSNDRRPTVADPANGICYDGLTPEGVNRNHGAESILSFQLSTCAMHALSVAVQPSTAHAARA